MLKKSMSHEPRSALSGSLFPPRAYILGAPKCGTTALAQYLSEHPQVAFSKPKEPHFFASDLPGLRRCATMDAYLRYFRPDDRTRLLMEGPVWHLYSRTAVKGILEARPDARFIVMLRHPVEMLASLHLQLIYALDEDQLDFRTAWELSEARARSECLPKACRAPATLIYTRTAAYGEMLERLFSLAQRGRCLVLFQEDMRVDTGAVYRRVLEFLGLDDDGRTAFPRVNEATAHRSHALHHLVARGKSTREAISRPLKTLLGVDSLGVLKWTKRLNSRKIERAEVPDDLFKEIARHYAEDMHRLSRSLGLDLGEVYGWPVSHHNIRE